MDRGNQDNYLAGRRTPQGAGQDSVQRRGSPVLPVDESPEATVADDCRGADSRTIAAYSSDEEEDDDEEEEEKWTEDQQYQQEQQQQDESDDRQQHQEWTGVTSNLPLYSPTDIQQLLRLVHSQAGNSAMNQREENYNSQFAAIPPARAPAGISFHSLTNPTVASPAAASTPQEQPLTGLLNAVSGVSQSQPLIASILSSPQALAMLIPLFLQWLQGRIEQATLPAPPPPPPPPPLSPQPPDQLSSLLQLLQHLLAATQQRPGGATNIQTFDTNTVLASLLQSFIYFQSRQHHPSSSLPLQHLLPQGGGIATTAPAVSTTAPVPLPNMYRVQAPTASVSWPWLANASPTASTSTAAAFNPMVAVGMSQQQSAAGENFAAEATRPRKKRKYKLEAFPQKLHRLIVEATANGKDSVVRFNEDGKQFQILNTAEFEKLLPGYFRHSNISSFKRCLHLYGFVRVCGTWEGQCFGGFRLIVTSTNVTFGI